MLLGVPRTHFAVVGLLDDEMQTRDVLQTAQGDLLMTPL